MKDLDPAALDCLAALADEGSFERAAQRLSITQSAVSQRLRGLETQVGRLLIVRSRPLRLTEAARRLLRFARQLHAMQADVARELGTELSPGERLPIAVNADSLATWVLPALDPLVQGGLREGYGLELIVDDQDFTHDSLREGAVLGCVSTAPRALRGCLVRPLGTMRYTALASPGFVAAQLPRGLNRTNFSRVPFLVFNRKDDTQALWVGKAFGVREPRLMARHVPSSEAYLRAALLGWGIGVMSELQARPWRERGELVALDASVTVDVALYWHQWKLGGEEAAEAIDAASDGAPVSTASRPRRAAGPDHRALLDRVGAALVEGARAALAEPARTLR